MLFASLTFLPAMLAVVGDRAFWPGRPTAEERHGRRDLWLAILTPACAGNAGRLQARSRKSSLFLGAGPQARLVGVHRLHAPDWFKQFRAPETDGTRGYAVLKSGFPPGDGCPDDGDRRSRSEATSSRPADIALAYAPDWQASPGVASVSGVQRRSTDGRAVSLQLTMTDDPFGKCGDRAHHPAATGGSPSLSPGLSVLLGEGSARQTDFKAASLRDTNVITPIVLVVVLITLIVLLRALVAPLFLLATVVCSYVATLGLSVLSFRYLFGQSSVDPEIRPILFIFLVALGSDYNIFLMSRLREEALRHGTREGMLRALVETGPVITSAGVILAGTFGVLMVLPIWELLELGFAVALGVLIDTFIVRSVLVPSIVWIKSASAGWCSSTAQSGGRAPVIGASFRIMPREGVGSVTRTRPDPRDIHANLPALEAVLAELDREDLDGLLCLGDVAPGPQPHETLARIRGLGCPVVMGNWDAWFLDLAGIAAGRRSGMRLHEITLFWAQDLDADDLAYTRTFVAARSRLPLATRRARALLSRLADLLRRLHLRDDARRGAPEHVR